MQFSQWFGRLCVKHGVTPTAVASAIGVSPASASYWIHGQSKPKKTTLLKIEDYFGEKFPGEVEEEAPVIEEKRSAPQSSGTDLASWLMEQSTPQQRQMLNFVVGGRHGCDVNALLILMAMICQLPDRDRLVVSQHISMLWKLCHKSRTLVCSEDILPDIATLIEDLKSGRDALLAK